MNAATATATPGQLISCMGPSASFGPSPAGIFASYPPEETVAHLVCSSTLESSDLIGGVCFCKWWLQYMDQPKHKYITR